MRIVFAEYDVIRMVPTCSANTSRSEMLVPDRDSVGSIRRSRRVDRRASILSLFSSRVAFDRLAWFPLVGREIVLRRERRSSGG